MKCYNSIENRWKGGGLSLKTFVRILIVCVILFVIGLYFSINEKVKNDSFYQRQFNLSKNNSLQNKNDEIQTSGVFNLIGKDTNEVIKQLGKPVRIDESVFGYKWWIYNDNLNDYIQVGIENGKVVTIYIIGEDVNITPFYIGQPVNEIYSSYFIESILSVKYNDQSYQFELSEEDINIRPIIQFENIFAQLYIDKFTGTLSSVRLMDAQTLVKLRPFSYRDQIIEKNALSEVNLNEGHEQQILDLTNILRSRYKINPIKRVEMAPKLIEKRSMELYEKLESPQVDFKLSEQPDRIKTGKYIYENPGENVAIHYIDAPAVVEGWFNSEVHRKNLLDKNYEYTEIDVYEIVYIEKFFSKEELDKYEQGPVQE